MGNLANIRSKVRQLTGRKSPIQLTDAQIDFQVNNYYQTEFPQQLRILDLREVHTFQTVPNVAVYPLDTSVYQSVEPPCYVAGYYVYFSMDRGQFMALWPQLQTNEVDVYGDGTSGSYSYTTNESPILKGSVLISAATSFNQGVTVTDVPVSATNNSSGDLILSDGTVTGSVNYETGDIIVDFGVPIPQGEPIQTQYTQYLASRPNMIFWYDNQITLYPVPDQAYDVSIVVYKIPTAMTSALESPELSEWWEALAYGAAMKIYENNIDMDGMKTMEELLERKLILIRRRSWYNLGTQRTKTIYAAPNVQQYYAGYYYPGSYSGGP